MSKKFYDWILTSDPISSKAVKSKFGKMML